jgi:hypothetical protein
VGGILRGSLAVPVYLGGLLFYGVRFLLFALACGGLFGGAVYWASLKVPAPGSITRDLFDAIIVFVSPIIAYTIIREKIRSLGRAPKPTVRRGLPAARRSVLSLGRPGFCWAGTFRAASCCAMTVPAIFSPSRPLAPARVGSVIPNLLVADRSVICIRSQGQNTRVTARACRRLGPVHVLDPFGITGQPSAAFNPWTGWTPPAPIWRRTPPPWPTPWCMTPPGEAGEAHWNEEAKALIAGLILYLVCYEAPDARTLALLREHLTCAPDVFENFLAACKPVGRRAAWLPVTGS